MWTIRMLVCMPLLCSSLACTGSVGTGTEPGSSPGQAPGSPTNGSPSGGMNGGSGVAPTPTVPTPPGMLPDACGEAGNVLPVQVRRLTESQYRQTLEKALGLTFSSEELPRFLDDNPTIGLANDPRKLKVTTVSIDSVYASAQAVSRRVIGEIPEVRDCVAATGATCFESIVDRIGGSLWRRPVSAQEKSSLMAAVADVALQTGTREEQMSFLLQALLMSPNMLYRPEIGDQAGKLTDYELASLLSYALWDGPPDARLLEVAASGNLRNPTMLASEAARLAGDPKYVSSVAGFMWDYLKLEKIKTVKKSGEYALADGVRNSMASSALQSLTGSLGASSATVMDVFDGTNFLVNDDLASYFGVPAPGSQELSAQSLDAKQRLGVLSHPAFLASHAGEISTSIVKRGVFVLEQLLAFEIPNPPANVAGIDPAAIPNLDPQKTSARVLLQVTHSAQTACMGCHNIIDPAGFGLENFDSVGRYRTVEKEAVPVDASGSLSVGPDSIVFQDSIEFIQKLTKTQAMRQSVLEHYFTYVLGQHGDGCEAKAFASSLTAGKDTLPDMAQLVVAARSFTSRKAAP